jgi:hypothetical protein
MEAPMKTMSVVGILGALALLLIPAWTAADEGESGMIECEMKFTLKGWSIFYKTASGSGSVTCANGQKAEVSITVKGGGITFGKYSIEDGFGRFNDLKGIDEIYGGYVAAEAHAGAGKSAQASVYTKGEVSLALTGKGRGVNVGFDFGKLTIKKKK